MEVGSRLTWFKWKNGTKKRRASRKPAHKENRDFEYSISNVLDFVSAYGRPATRATAHHRAHRATSHFGHFGNETDEHKTKPQNLAAKVEIFASQVVNSTLKVGLVGILSDKKCDVKVFLDIASVFFRDVW